MKIGMIGTSHTACIKAGFDMVSDDLGDSISVEFFAVGGNYFNCFQQESDGVLRAVKGSDFDCDMARKQALNINGKTELDLSDFDVICVVGAETGIDAVSRLMAQVDVGDAPSGGLDAMSLISSNTFAGIQSDLIKGSLQKWMLLEQEGQQHFLMPSPFPFEKFLDPSVGGQLGQGINIIGKISGRVHTCHLPNPATGHVDFPAPVAHPAPPDIVPHKAGEGGAGSGCHNLGVSGLPVRNRYLGIGLSPPLLHIMRKIRILRQVRRYPCPTFRIFPPPIWRARRVTFSTRPVVRRWRSPSIASHGSC